MALDASSVVVIVLAALAGGLLRAWLQGLQAWAYNSVVALVVGVFAGWLYLSEGLVTLAGLAIVVLLWGYVGADIVESVLFIARGKRTWR